MAVPPGQTKVFASTTCGSGLTVTVEKEVELHPLASVPVTAYDVDVVGVTVTVELLDPSGLQE